MTFKNSSATITLLQDRRQYRHCHIQVPDLDGRLPAIEFNRQYYYFLKIVPDEQRAVHLADKLRQKQDSVLITPTPKGRALWVLETEVLSPA